MHNGPYLIGSAACALGLFAIVASYSKLAKRRDLPPGPKGLPLIGNVADLPSSQPWLKFAEMGKKYGGMTYLNVLGTSILILNSPEHAFELLDKKSKISSDRPVLTMGGKLVGWDQGPALIQFGDTWSQYRRLISQFMGTPAKVEKFGHVFQQETNQYLKDILDNPEDWTHHTRHFAGSIVLIVVYGYLTNDPDDKLIKLVDDAMEQFSETTAANAFMVDIFPILRFVPEWFPGAAWKKKVTIYSSTLKSMLDIPFQWVQEQMTAGTSQSCFVSDLLLENTKTLEEMAVIKWAAAGIYSGGADTTVAAIEAFIFALTIHQEEQVKAQAEIDTVLGRGSLPTLADRARLPHFEGLFAEVMRVYTLGPIGLPHVTTEPLEYDGYFIPKGTMILTNNWQFFRDPSTYSEPEVFRPERFMGPKKEKDPRDFLFGYGRRVCPGVHFADQSMWIACVSLLTAFYIRPAVKDGKPVPIAREFTDGGSISRPPAFGCTITPRLGYAQTISLL
ncbi:cytochrome P450 [Mycena floridula]|nr:cytochrome P450 [Mycena floridula]